MFKLVNAFSGLRLAPVDAPVGEPKGVTLDIGKYLEIILFSRCMTTGKVSIDHDEEVFSLLNVFSSQFNKTGGVCFKTNFDGVFLNCLFEAKGNNELFIIHKAIFFEFHKIFLLKIFSNEKKRFKDWSVVCNSSMRFPFFTVSRNDHMNGPSEEG